jgi:hypothetical protein
MKIFALVGLLVLGATLLAVKERAAPPPPQDAIRLEARINQLEQRLYTIETGMRTLEQQSRVGVVTSRSVTPEDVAALRVALQSLDLRLADDECAIAKLDERTLSPAARAARIRSGASRTEPCRLNADTPVRLPERR